MQQIRQARASDIPLIYAFDHLAVEPGRREFIKAVVNQGNTRVAVTEQQITGYMVLEYTFYGQGFISMLYIHPQHRRRGTGTALIYQAEAQCRTEKLFTSTNTSNLPMQGLLCKLGYTPSGIINNLDEGDPEIIYFKRLQRDRAE